MMILSLVTTVGFAVLVVLVFGLLRFQAEIFRALHRAGVPLDDLDIPAGYTNDPGNRRIPAATGEGRAHDVAGVSPGGGALKVSVTATDQLILLAFLSSGCRTCERFWKAFADPALRLPGVGTRLVIVGQDAKYESEKVFARLVPPGVKAVLSSQAWEDYDVPGSPYLVLVDGGSGRVLGSGTAPDWEQMRGMLVRVLDVKGDGPPRRRRRPSTRNREMRADEALREAGIDPDHEGADENGGAHGEKSRPDSGMESKG